MSEAQALVPYSFLGRAVEITPAKLVVGLLLLVFAIAELLPSFRNLSFRCDLEWRYACSAPDCATTNDCRPVPRAEGSIRVM
jgi:hypothetical protein